MIAVFPLDVVRERGTSIAVAANSGGPCEDGARLSRFASRCERSRASHPSLRGGAGGVGYARKEGRFRWGGLHQFRAGAPDLLHASDVPRTGFPQTD